MRSSGHGTATAAHISNPLPIVGQEVRPTRGVLDISAMLTALVSRRRALWEVIIGACHRVRPSLGLLHPTTSALFRSMPTTAIREACPMLPFAFAKRSQVSSTFSESSTASESVSAATRSLVFGTALKPLLRAAVSRMCVRGWLLIRIGLNVLFVAIPLSWIAALAKWNYVYTFIRACAFSFLRAS